MVIKMLSKSQRNEKKLIKPLSDFFKTKNGKPFCFGEFGGYHTKKPCSDCKYKKGCYDEFNKN